MYSYTRSILSAITIAEEYIMQINTFLRMINY